MFLNDISFLTVFTLFKSFFYPHKIFEANTHFYQKLFQFLTSNYRYRYL